MKINVPVVRQVQVGVAQHYGTDRVYFDASRPNVIQEFRESPIREPRIESLTVFDKDLKVVRRSKGVIAFGAITALVPVAYVAMAGATVLDAAIKFVVSVGTNFSALNDEFGPAFRKATDAVVGK